MKELTNLELNLIKASLNETQKFVEKKNLNNLKAPLVKLIEKIRKEQEKRKQ